MLRFKSIVAIGIVGCFSFISCEDDVLPKPDAMLALEYTTPEYSRYRTADCPYTFEKNDMTMVKMRNGCSAIIEYPKMNASLYLTYRNVEDDIERLLIDAQKLTYEHVIKADKIYEEKYINNLNGVYGMFYDVAGNAASQSQFYVTDSTSHFLTGSIYFNVRPNYDSILPAADYLKNDIRHLMESLNWKK